MNNEELALKTVQACLSRIVAIEARCDAITTAVIHLSAKHGIPKDSVLAAIDKVEKVQVQKRLDRLEEGSPALAAELDWRDDIPDIGLS